MKRFVDIVVGASVAFAGSQAAMIVWSEDAFLAVVVAAVFAHAVLEMFTDSFGGRP